MNARLIYAFLPCVLLAAGCASPDRGTVPEVICGVRSDPGLTRLIVAPGSEWREYNRVDREQAITAPCSVLSGKKVILDLGFSWRPTAADLMYLARNTGNVTGVTAPRAVDSRYDTVVGTDGAISQAPCQTKTGNYFTLTLQLPQIKLADQTHRNDIEKFMRVYFPATVGTLGCRR
ncbi:hypothetical protein ACIQMP_21275 [Streptomyces sp. NPDC091385]|uniref:hypothetical protein n=1 Tax=Streptomyces sp. NPDC091385 TaxID=3365997 RepID=UPI00380E6E2A